MRVAIERNCMFRSGSNKSTVVSGRPIKTCVLALALACPFSERAIAAPVLSSEEIAAVKLPDVRITSAVHHDALDSEEGIKVAHVKLEAVIADSIHIELLLPDKWNERFVMGGGGGYVGSVQNSARQYTNDGYATAGTDTGHQGWGAEWALHDLEAIVNFGHLAVHRTAEVSKALIRAYYGKDSRYCYFVGCSRGGGQGAMEAQRYPGDFDGIVAGCPAAFDYIGLTAFELKVAQTMYPNPNVLEKTLLTQQDLEYLRSEVMKQLDELDGIRDDVINDPLNVELDWSRLTDLTDEKRDAVRAIYEGVKNIDGLDCPGAPLGSESSWFIWLVGPTQWGATASHFFSTSFGENFVFHDPDWDYSTYDLSNWRKDSEFIASTMNANDPDLRPFADNGGKLIVWHGWSDPVISGKAIVDYYQEVLKVDPQARDYARLFMVPGCGHCGGGSGASEVNWLKVIVDWVENQHAPERIIARKAATDSTPAMTRPLYPYPQKAEYRGEGDVNDPASFRAVP